MCDREQGKEICVHVGPWVSGLTFGCVMVVVVRGGDICNIYVCVC